MRGDTTFSLLFRTHARDVLLLYNTGARDPSPSFFSVELSGGLLRIAASTGSDRGQVMTSPGPGLSDGQWHEVAVRQTAAKSFEVKVDGRYF